MCKRVLEKWVLRAPGHGAELHGEERLLAPAPVPDLRRQETRQNVTADGGVGWSGDYALYGHVVGDFVVLPTSPTACPHFSSSPGKAAVVWLTARGITVHGVEHPHELCDLPLPGY